MGKTSGIGNATRFSSCENSAKIVGQTPYTIETVLDYARNQGSATRRECQKDPCCSQAPDQDQRLDGRRVKNVPWGVAPRVTSLSASIGATEASGEAGPERRDRAMEGTESNY